MTANRAPVSASSRRRLALATVVLALLAAAVLPLAPGCSENPAPPAWDNPFDPQNGDTNPFDVNAVFAGDNVLVTWNQLEGYGIETYEVQHRVAGGNWSIAGTVEATTGQASFQFPDPAPTATNEFRVIGIDEFGRRSATSGIVAASVVVPPLVSLDPDESSIASRIQDVLVAATSGDSVEVSVDSFTTRISLPLDPSGVTRFAAVDLGPAEANGDRIQLLARTVTYLAEGLPPVYSGNGYRQLTVSLTPRVSLASGGRTVARPAADVVISGEAAGIDSLRFALSEDGLADAAWQPAAAAIGDVPLADTTMPQVLWAEFATGFGFVAVDSQAVAADPLIAADFALDLPGNRISQVPAITVLHDAVATRMRVSQYPDFQDAPWTAYADTSQIVLDGEAGLYLVYAQYDNHWFDSAVRTDFVIFGEAEVQVDFAYPQQDVVVRGGSTIEVAGTAQTFDAEYPLTGVQVHLGDGWVDATGDANWEVAWDVPLLGEDTVWPLGAEATAENGTTGDVRTGQAWISVIISQLTVAITAPEDAGTVTAGEVVSVGGTAAPFLAGAPLDSVAVIAGAERLTATGLESWTADWTVPTDLGNPLVDITAWAYAGGDSVSDGIQIEVVAPGR
jgi:hypothetical protein